MNEKDITVHVNGDSFEEKLAQSNKEFDYKRKEIVLECHQKRQKAENLNLAATTAKKVRANKEEAWNDMIDALGINKKDIGKTKRQSTIRSIVNMFYLLVIVGCELDLYGFMMAYSTYWFMGYTVVNILLIVAPVGYFISIGLYMKNFEEGSTKNEKKKKKSKTPDLVNELCSGQGSQKKINGFSPDNLPAMKPERPPLKLEYYHFVPVLRYYLVIKEKVPADVEGIFRVNSLSSFTLGIAQIISIVFQIFVAKEAMTIFIKINIGSQIINWIITILYFMTSISSRMTASIAIAAMTANSKDGLRHSKETHMELIRQGAFSGDLTKAKAFEKVIDREIVQSGDLEDQNIDLSIYPMDFKFKALGLLRQLSTNTYAEI